LEVSVARRSWVIALSGLLLLPACEQEKQVDPAAQAAAMKKRLGAAREFVKEDKFEDARAIYKGVLAAEPNHPESLWGMGRLAYEDRNYDKALELLEKAVAGAPDNAEFHATLGEVAFNHKKFARSATAYGKAFALDEGNGDYGIGQAKALKEAKKYEEAEKVLLVVAEEDEQAEYVYTELGGVLLALDRQDEALRSYMKAQTIHPADTKARAGAALVYEAKGDTKHALDEWSAYIRMDCCSDYSKNVARKKMVSLKQGPAEGGDEG